VAIGDLNGDGKADLATANSDQSSDQNTVSVFLNRGDGSFEPRHDYTTGRDPDSLAIGDLNGDGKRDVVTANVDANTVSVLLNRGDGTFLPRVDYPAGLSPVSIAIGDLNGDGKSDLAVANFVGHTVSVFLNRGDGTFEARRNSWTGPTRPSSIAIGDLNGDGAPDLVSVQRFTVCVFLNRGDGTFQANHRFDVNGEYSVATGDLNGDGKADLAVANVEDDLVAVLLNKGNGTFRTEYEYELEYTTRHPIAITIADLNRDGKRDLVTANDRFVSVLINKPGVCDVQYVLEAKLPLAKRAIARANCRVGTVRRTFSQEIKKGRVISQKPEFGAVLRGGAKVSLVVSRGRKR